MGAYDCCQTVTSPTQLGAISEELPFLGSGSGEIDLTIFDRFPLVD
jgi:hypothetical protein